MPRTRPLSLASLLVLAVACSGRQQSDVSAPREASSSDVLVQIVSHSFLDVDVRAHMGAKSRRLGLATGHSVTVFRIPWRDLSGATLLRVSVDPVGTADRIQSGSLDVQPGSLVTWTLQPTPGASTVSIY